MDSFPDMPLMLTALSSARTLLMFSKLNVLSEWFLTGPILLVTIRLFSCRANIWLPNPCQRNQRIARTPNIIQKREKTEKIIVSTEKCLNCSLIPSINVRAPHPQINRNQITKTAPPRLRFILTMIFLRSPVSTIFDGITFSLYAMLYVRFFSRRCGADSCASFQVMNPSVHHVLSSS